MFHFIPIIYIFVAALLTYSSSLWSSRTICHFVTYRSLCFATFTVVAMPCHRYALSGVPFSQAGPRCELVPRSIRFQLALASLTLGSSHRASGLPVETSLRSVMVRLKLLLPFTTLRCKAAFVSLHPPFSWCYALRLCRSRSGTSCRNSPTVVRVLRIFVYTFSSVQVYFCRNLILPIRYSGVWTQVRYNVLAFSKLQLLARSLDKFIYSIYSTTNYYEYFRYICR